MHNIYVTTEVYGIMHYTSFVEHLLKRVRTDESNLFSTILLQFSLFRPVYTFNNNVVIIAHRLLALETMKVILDFVNFL